MKSKLLILAGMLLFCQLSFSLSCMYRGYLKESNKVFYVHGKDKEELKNIDYKTFEVVDSLPHFDLLAKDKKNVYYQGKVVKGVNPKTFKIVKENFPQIRDHGNMAAVLPDISLRIREYSMN